ncbi:MAG: NMD3-related protein [Candidatus Altiarchaeota archaeon]
MSSVPCPKCGKPARGVCAECHISGHPIAVKQENFRDCGCGLGFFKGRWYEDRQELLTELVKKSIRPQSGLQLKVLGVESEESAGRLHLTARVQGSYSGSIFKTDVCWDIRPEKVKCDSCVKLGSGYYEAILQLRDGIELDLDPKQISSLERTRGGHDFYMISMDYAQKQVSDLIAKGFLVKQSSKLYGKKNGRDMFRFYYSIKRPHFSRGDFLGYEGGFYQVRELGKMVKLTQITSGRHSSATVNRLEDAKVLAKEKDVREAIVTGLRPDGIQLMDSETGETHETPAKEGLKHGDKIPYIILSGKVYLLE